MIGRIGNRTTVGNQEQVIEGIRRAVYDAVSSASVIGREGRPIKIYLDGKEVGTADRRYEQSVSRETGVSMA